MRWNGKQGGETIPGIRISPNSDIGQTDRGRRGILSFFKPNVTDSIPPNPVRFPGGSSLLIAQQSQEALRKLDGIGKDKQEMS